LSILFSITLICPVPSDPNVVSVSGLSIIGNTRHRTKVRENQRGNQECTIQRHWQHWEHKAQDK
jgi:hypothetical protein